jgi:nucleotide-binding universal stress UspA family protein
MAYKTILVSLNEVARLPQLLETARYLGKTFGAHVSGLYVIPAVQFYPSVGYEAMPQFFDGNQIYFRDNAKTVQDGFEKAMKAEGLSFDFQLVNAATANVSDEVIARGHCADLIVLSAANVDLPAGVEPDFVEQVVMAAGRPVMILPLKGDAKLDFSSVVLGWNDGREAARAAFDALPLLRQAKSVSVVRLDPQKAPELKGKIAGADVAESLARHKVKAEILNLPTVTGDSGQALLTCASDRGAGLIVMGAYGHSRLREFIFGGATIHVMSNLDRPVLMSH